VAPFSSAYPCLGSGEFLSGDRPGGTTSFVRDRVASTNDVLRSGPHIFAGHEQAHSLSGRYWPAGPANTCPPLPRPSRARPPARCAALDCLVARGSPQLRPAGAGNDLASTSLWKLKTKKQPKSLREGRESFVADPVAHLIARVSIQVPHAVSGTTQDEKRGRWRRSPARRRERGRILLGAESPYTSLTLATRSTTHCRHPLGEHAGESPPRYGLPRTAARSVMRREPEGALRAVCRV
jgi:hypothetical protein